MQYALQLGLMRYRRNLAAIGSELTPHNCQGGGGENDSHHSARCGAFRDGALPAPADVAVVSAPMGGLETRRPAAAEMAVKVGAERREMGAGAAGRSAFGIVAVAGARSQLGVSTGLTVMAGDGVGLMPLRWSARAGAQRRRVVGIKPTDRGAGKGVSFIIRSAVGGDATRALTPHIWSGWGAGKGVSFIIRPAVGSDATHALTPHIWSGWGAGKGVSFIIRSVVGSDGTRAFTMHIWSGWGAGKGVSFIIRSAVGSDALRAFTMHTQSGWDGGAAYASVAVAVRGVVGNAG